MVFPEILSKFPYQLFHSRKKKGLGTSQPRPSSPDTIPLHFRAPIGVAMIEPKVSRPYWPDALQKPSSETTGLKSWPWAPDPLQNSTNNWTPPPPPNARPHPL